MKRNTLADILKDLLSGRVENHQLLIEEILNRFESKALTKNKLVLSRLLLDRHFKVYLTDLNVEVKMHALPKALFVLYLLHPEGIPFKELYLHKEELLNIYHKVTNKYNKIEIERAINDLVDMSKPSINQKSTRIRQAFRLHMNEESALFYYPNGPKNHPKRIHLPQSLITILATF